MPQNGKICNIIYQNGREENNHNKTQTKQTTKLISAPLSFLALHAHMEPGFWAASGKWQRSRVSQSSSCLTWCVLKCCHLVLIVNAVGEISIVLPPFFTFFSFRLWPWWPCMYLKYNCNGSKYVHISKGKLAIMITRTFCYSHEMRSRVFLDRTL